MMARSHAFVVAMALLIATPTCLSFSILPSSTASSLRLRRPASCTQHSSPRHSTRITQRFLASLEAGERPAQTGEGGTLSDSAKAILRKVMKRPMFAVDTVGGGGCKEAFFSRRYLSVEDLTALEGHAASKGDAEFAARRGLVELLASQRAEIVAEGKKRVDAFPGIYEPGGGLYPPIRAKRCEEDFHAFLQLACYAVAAGEPSFSDEEGVKLMCELYREMQVPLDPMVAGVEGLRDASGQAAKEAGAGGAWGGVGKQSFDHLLTVLKGIRASISAAA